MTFERHESHKLLQHSSKISSVSQNSWKGAVFSLLMLCFWGVLWQTQTLLQMPPKHIVGKAMGFPFFGHLLEISPSPSSDLRASGMCLMVLKFWDGDLRAWDSGTIIHASWSVDLKYLDCSDLCAFSSELPILWAVLLALLSLLVALLTKKNKTTINSQIRSFSLMFSYEKCEINQDI